MPFALIYPLLKLPWAAGYLPSEPGCVRLIQGLHHRPMASSMRLRSKQYSLSQWMGDMNPRAMQVKGAKSVFFFFFNPSAVSKPTSLYLETAGFIRGHDAL